MNYQRHRDHVADGTYPWPACPYCQAAIKAANRDPAYDGALDLGYFSRRLDLAA